jgi:serine/threonine-protein kinase
MGVVVEAVHVTLGHRVAVKLVHGVGDSRRALSRFLHEARVAAQLPGEHICRAIDVGRAKSGAPFLIMELLIGRDLQAELDARRRIPVSEAVDLLLQACEGMAEAHAAGLVHRDLKPANIFLSQRRDGSRLVKVLDFGISKWVLGGGARTVTCGTAGTPAYMAPEQFEIDAKVDARCDQHALAVVLYEMLAGAPPFVAQSAYSLALMIAREEPRPIREIAPEVPAPLEAAIRKALSKAPDERFPDLAAFARAITPFGGEGARASLRNITGILAAAAAVGIVTVRSSASKALSQRPAPTEDRTASPFGADTLDVTLPSEAAPPESRCSHGFAQPTDDHKTAAQGRPRRLGAGAVAISVAAIGFAGILFDAGNPNVGVQPSPLSSPLTGAFVRTPAASAAPQGIAPSPAPIPADLSRGPVPATTASGHPVAPRGALPRARVWGAYSRPIARASPAASSPIQDRTAREVFGARR